MKYKTLSERIAARREQMKAASRRQDTKRNPLRKAKRQAAAGIFPMWKGVAIIDSALKMGFTFQESMDALNEVLAEQGMKLRADCR